MASDSLAISRRITERLFAYSDRPPRVRAWEGSEWGPTESAATLVLKHPGALRALLLPANDLTAGEAYLNDDVDIEGDIFGVLEFAGDLLAAEPGKPALLRLALDLRRLPSRHQPDSEADHPEFAGKIHSRSRDRDAVRYHYDTGNEFYATFLGDTMVYSCAYYLDPTESLDTAQRRKLDVVCRKLGLRRGSTLLDIGCGWGSLAIHAAANYGAEVVGSTLSPQQADHARRLAKQLRVDDRVTILESDYRDLGGEYDAVASVGMVEHVGRSNLATYFETVRRLLAPGGRFLNHGITTRDRSKSYGRRPTFVSTYVFPDGELAPIEMTIATAEAAGFEVRDVESLRMSYAATLRAWVSNLEDAGDEAIRHASDRIFRIWRVYMAGSAIAFERAGISVYQTLLADPSAPWQFGRRGLLAADDAAS